MITSNHKNGWLLITQQVVMDHSWLQLLTAITPSLTDLKNVCIVTHSECKTLWKKSFKRSQPDRQPTTAQQWCKLAFIYP